VACLSGTAFGEYGEGYLRFSVANSQENLNKALARLKTGWKEPAVIKWSAGRALPFHPTFGRARRPSLQFHLPLTTHDRDLVYTLCRYDRHRQKPRRFLLLD